MLWKIGRQVIFDREGKKVIPCIYDEVSDGGFHDGLCCVIKDGLRGYIDRDGKVVIPFRYDGLTPFKEGLAKACKGKRRCYIDRNGKIIIRLD